MSFRGRRRRPGAWLIAALALVFVAPASVLAAGPSVGVVSAPQRPAEIPTPREMQAGGSTGFRLPFPAGESVRIEQGWNTSFSHKGRAAFAYDFGLTIGTPVLAAAAGVVAYTHDGERACGGSELRRDANYVTINHPDGSATQYGHLATVGVKVGDVVAAGQVIGKSGDTGYSQCLAHLHFARQFQGGPVKQSVPVYFEGYAKKEFHSGEYVTAPSAPCTAPTAGGAAADEGGVAYEGISGAFCGSYFGGAFEGPALFTRQDAALIFDWQAHGPGGYWLDDATAAFSARWSGRFTFASAGVYTIGVIASGAVTVSIDGEPVVERLDQGQPIEVILAKSLGAGIHQVDVEYLSTAGHGVLKVGWGRLLADE